MSLANEQQFAMDQELVETNDESNKKPRISYTRKFLLSMSDENVCKKMPNLPTEFHESLMLDSEDPSPERVRISGDFSSHGFRRNDYSSSPPTRGYHGRWEGRSSGWSDKDSDSQSDRESETGRRSGMPSRRPWQTPEHDGLLGRGSFPKTSGVGAGTSGSRPLSNDSYKLSKTNEPYQPPRSNEPYQPPRPYKAPPYTRRDTRDSFNDETFGSSDSTSEARAEEERKRRASFELLRKEHQKAFQERQKSNPDLRKNDFDFTELLGESKDAKGRPSRNDEANNTPTIPGSSNTSFSSQTNTPKPLVPPGFASTVLERKQGGKSQIETSQYEHSPLNSEVFNTVNGTSANDDEKQLGIKIGSGEMLVEGENVCVTSTDPSARADKMFPFVGISTDTVNKDKSFEKLFSISTPAETQGYPRKSEEATVSLDKKKSLEKSDGPSILDKIFDTAISLNSSDSSNTTKNVEERRNPQMIESSSKFAYLFLEEDNKPVEDLPSNKPPGGLLSLLQGAERMQTFDPKSKSELSMDFPFQGLASKSSDQISNTSTSKSVPSVLPVLTCEDLEQSILSEVTESYHPPSSPFDQHSSVSSMMKTKQQKTSVDDQASQHLLSLLQRGGDPKDQDTQLTQLFSGIESRPRPSVKPTAAGEADPGKSLTLENLFGSAFMNELQSIGEPVSGRAMVSDAPGAPLRSDRSIGELSQRNQIRLDGPGGLLGLSEDPATQQKYMSFPGSHNQESEAGFNISDKLAALNSSPNMGGQDGLYLHNHLQQYASDPSPPVFHPFDSRHANLKPQVDYMGLGSITAQHHDLPPNHRFPGNMIHRPTFHHTTTNGGGPEFDRRPPHMMEKMHMQDKLQHHHLMQGFPGGGPQYNHLPPHVNNQMPGIIPELNPSQGFPFSHRQPNYGMPPQGSQVNRGNHPASVMGMDPTKQIPVMGQAGGLNRQGPMNHELEFGFGYR
ncbi:unnamed protein product [Cochlearia groenlandica]